MKITKYEHACVVIEENGKNLVIDPGMFSQSVNGTKDVVAIVITHVHSDHMDEAIIKTLLQNNPDARIFSVAQVADALPDLKIERVSPGEGMDVPPFKLEFFGGDHAVIHPSRPQDQNIGVLVNNVFYYPGDSFTLPHREIAVLAAPAAAPWMKVSEAMDFVAAVKPDRAFPTHDAVLSDGGKQFHDSMIDSMAKQSGVQYERIQTGESITV